MADAKNPFLPIQYSCKKCNFICSNKKDYTRHTTTAKHKMLTLADAKNPILPIKAFVCDCGKEYCHRQSLFKHKQSCRYIDQVKYEAASHKSNDVTCDTYDTTDVTNTVLLLLKQNQEFKQLMVEQHAENMQLHKQLVNVVKEGSIVNNHTTNHNNQRFNLNFFLNDTCKDAMSITDFLRNMNVHIDELEYIGNHGYVNGMTKMIMDRLKDMDITKRPIHCTDIKRETMYIKDDAGWSKDTDELTKLRKILSRISMNNYRTVPDWRIAHPDCEVMETQNYEFCYKMMRAILGDVEDEQIKLDNKIIKTMAKELFVQK